jgi:ATP-dependent DNA helicase RecQ
MKVVIVAKTRQGSGACIGGITFEGQSVRLVAADADSNESAGMEYNVGDVWQVEASPAENIIPPHVENIIVHHKRRLPPLDDPIAFIQRHMPPHVGGLDVLYEGRTQATNSGALYISERAGIPPYSTTFWRPDQPLQREDDAKRIRYRYPTADGGRSLTFVGFQEPPDALPAGTLLRVSLAHWWLPPEIADGEYRCFVQLSGYFWPQAIDPWPWAEAGWEAPIESPALQPGAVSMPSPSTPPDMATAQELLKSVFGYDEFNGTPWPLCPLAAASHFVTSCRRCSLTA